MKHQKGLKGSFGRLGPQNNEFLLKKGRMGTEWKCAKRKLGPAPRKEESSKSLTRE